MTSKRRNPDDPNVRKPYSQLPPAPEFIAKPALMSNEVHLWSGETGVGKTGLMLQTIASWRKEDPIFGCKSYPMPFCYISSERSRKMVLRALKRLSINPDDNFPIFSSFDKHLKTLESAVEMALEIFPDTRVIFLDSLTKFIIGDPNRTSTVSSIFDQASVLMEKWDLTFVATTCASKAKVGEHYLNLRQRVSGSMMFGSSAATIIVIEFGNPQNPHDPRRTVHILDVNGDVRTLHYTVNTKTGLFTIAPEDVENISDFKRIVFARGEGGILLPSELSGICQTVGVCLRMGQRYMKELVEEGQVRRGVTGIYTVAKPQ